MLDQSLDLALDFLKAHPTWYIFPIARLEKLPPLIEDNLVTASNDPKQIKLWHAKWRGCNWGLALKKSKVIAVDVDTKPGKVGQATLDDLTMEHGELPPTLTVRTPSGGLHYYFNGEHIFALGKNGFGVDVDSPNYVLIPGCWLCVNSEQGYEAITDAPVADAPAWFGEYLKERVREEADQSDSAVDLDKAENVTRMIRYLQEGAPPSIMNQNGDITLFQVVCTLKDNGISAATALQLLMQHYNPRCNPPWSVGTGPDKDRLDVKVQNVYTYARENKIGSATAEYQFGDPTDAVDPVELIDWKKRMDAGFKKQQTEKLKAKIAKGTSDAEKGIDQLTGEPIEDDDAGAVAEIDPLTGEPPDPDDEPPAGGAGTGKNSKTGNATGTPPGKEPPKDRQGGKFVRDNWIWIVSMEKFMRLSDGLMWSARQFDSFYNNLAQRGSYSSQLFSTDTIRKVERLVYRPGKDVFLDGGKSINLWRPSSIVPKQGDTALWEAHLNYLFQDENDKNRVLNWMAWVYQNQERKPNHGLLLVGRNTGTGKSWIARVLEQLIGPENTQRPKNTSLKGDFNAWALQCKLCIIEELMQIGRREVANELRDTITESTIEVNIKNVTAQKIENYMAMMAITNHRDAMPMEETERRWLVVETFAQRIGGPEDPNKDRENDSDASKKYYKRLFDVLDNDEALAAIAYELQTRKLGTYDAAQAPDETGARQQMIELSRSDAETWLYENRGNYPLAANLVCVSEVVSAMPNNLQRQARLHTTIKTFLRDKCRGIPLTNPVRCKDGQQYRVWTLNGKSYIDKLQPAEISALYEIERKKTGSNATPEEQAVADFED